MDWLTLFLLTWYMVDGARRAPRGRSRTRPRGGNSRTERADDSEDLEWGWIGAEDIGMKRTPISDYHCSPKKIRCYTLLSPAKEAPSAQNTTIQQSIEGHFFPTFPRSKICVLNFIPEIEFLWIYRPFQFRRWREVWIWPNCPKWLLRFCREFGIFWSSPSLRWWRVEMWSCCWCYLT